LEQSPYTTLLRLTYYFPHNNGQVHGVPDSDPDILFRAYHDAGQVEVLDLRQTMLPTRAHHLCSTLEAKCNLFLSKWLAFCLTRGHGFSSEPGTPFDSEIEVLGPDSVPIGALMGS